jgi:hypothetical protein
MQRLGIACAEPREMPWGTLFEIMLPGGGKLGVYEPHHAHPAGAVAGKTPATKAKHRGNRLGRAKRRRPARW